MYVVMVITKDSEKVYGPFERQIVADMFAEDARTPKRVTTVLKVYDPQSLFEQ